MKPLLLFLFLLQIQTITAQSYYETEDSVAVTGQFVFGSLTIPNHSKSAVPLLILISGSGPTDRNGNSFIGLKTDAYKKLSYALAEKKIACFRYDKRGVAKSLKVGLKESELRFDDYVNDAKKIIEKFKSDTRFSTIVVAGHSEGSLIGMLSAEKSMKFISIAGISRSANNALKVQLQGKLGDYEELCFAKLDSLKNGQTIACDIPGMESIFRPAILPYLINWFQYEPSIEIKKRTAATLIINGTNDLQVPDVNAKDLKHASPTSILKIIPNMNHTLTEVTTEEDNTKSYHEPDRPLSPALIASLVEFILH